MGSGPVPVAAGRIEVEVAQARRVSEGIVGQQAGKQDVGLEQAGGGF